MPVPRKTVVTKKSHAFLLPAVLGTLVAITLNCMSLKETFNGGMGCLIYIALIGLYVSGSLHSVKKHDEGSSAWWFPPIGLYRGFEQFWHNDYADIDWQQRLTSDAQAEFAFLDRAIAGRFSDSNRKEMEDFSTKINAYPKDKIQYLKTAANDYLSLNNSMFNCIDGYVDTLLKSEEIVVFRWDNQFAKEAGMMQEKYKTYEIEETANFLDSSINALDSGYISGAVKTEYISYYQNTIKETKRGMMPGFKKAYYAIFKEEYE